MDIGELMKFKPATAPKRPALGDTKGGHEDDEDDIEDDDPNESYESRAAKRRKKQKSEANKRRRREEQDRMAMLEAEAAMVREGQGQEYGQDDGGSGLTEAQKRNIQALLDKGDEAPDATLDEATIKKLVLNFEKRALRNQEMRVKFADDPKKFMESEVELHEAVQELRVLATAPDQYPLLVELKCVPSFLGLLSHENTDITVAVVELVQELTDVDTLNDAEDGAAAELIDALLEQQVAPLLIQNLERLNDSVKEESDGVHNTLSIFENLVEFRPEMCKEAAEAGLLTWLVRKLKVKVAFDNNKLYASEILSILLQTEPDNRKRVGEMTGAVDSLLQQLAYYKRHNPGRFTVSHFLLLIECNSCHRFPGRVGDDGEPVRLLLLADAAHPESRPLPARRGTPADEPDAEREEGLTQRRPQGAGPRAERQRRQGQLPQVHRHPGTAHHLPAVHEDPKEVQAEGGERGRARGTRRVHRRLAR